MGPGGGHGRARDAGAWARDVAVTRVRDAVPGAGLGCGGCSFDEGPGGSGGVTREAWRIASRCGSGAGCGGTGSAGGGVGLEGRWCQEPRTTATRIWFLIS